MLEMDYDFAPAVVIRHAVDVSGFLVFFKGVWGELLSDGTFHIKSIAVPGGNFLMPRVVGWAEPHLQGARCPLNKGTRSGSPRRLHFWQGPEPKATTAHRHFLHAIFNWLKVKHWGEEAQALAPVPVWHSSQMSLLDPSAPFSALRPSRSKLFLYSVPAKYVAKYALLPGKAIGTTGTNTHTLFFLSWMKIINAMGHLS